MNFGSWAGSECPLHFASTLGGAAWAALVGVPVGRHRSVLPQAPEAARPACPARLLWRRSLEDLHVNSLFQRSA